jgi:hypothetical protein
VSEKAGPRFQDALLEAIERKTEQLDLGKGAEKIGRVGSQEQHDDGLGSSKDNKQQREKNESKGKWHDGLT